MQDLAACMEILTSDEWKCVSEPAKLFRATIYYDGDLKLKRLEHTP